jgi:DNA topoisomerase-2
LTSSAATLASSVHLLSGARVVSQGVATVLSPTRVEISELPVGKWTSDYKLQLLKMLDQGKISGFKEAHAEEKPRFTVTFDAQALLRVLAGADADLDSDAVDADFNSDTNVDTADADAQAFRLRAHLKLEAPLPGGLNFTCFGSRGKDNVARLRKYDSAEALADDWFPVRLALYGERKQAMEQALGRRAAALGDRARFISLVLSREVDLASGKLSAADVVAKLKAHGFREGTGGSGRNQEGDGGGGGGGRDNGSGQRAGTFTAEGLGYHDGGGSAGGGGSALGRLLALPLSSLTKERVVSASKERDGALAALEALRRQSPVDLWLDDLASLEKELRNDPKLLPGSPPAGAAAGEAAGMAAAARGGQAVAARRPYAR